MSHHKVIVIGTGPAGYTAALYASRANLAPLVFEGVQPGGQLTITTEVENFPGFRQGIAGPALMDEMREQVIRFGTTIKPETVLKAELQGRPFKVTTDQGEYTADAVIIATGASAKWLGIGKDEQLSRSGGGVSACATCDGFFFRGKEIAVVGGGDTAIEEATFLTKFATKVHLIHRRDKLRASKAMQDRALKNEKIQPDLEQDRAGRDHRHPRDPHGREGGEDPGPEAEGHSGRQRNRAAGGGSVRGHRPPAQHRPLRRPAAHGRDGLPRSGEGFQPHLDSRRLRLRRRAGSRLPPGHHGRGQRLHGRHRRRALAGGTGSRGRGGE